MTKNVLTKNKKLSSILLVLSLGVALAGCGSGSGDSGNSEGKSGETSNDKAAEFGKDPLSFSFYLNYDWAVTDPWADNPATKWILDNKKVTVVPVQSGGAAQQKFSTMQASGDLPDVIQMDRGGDVEKLRSAGLLVPLDEYYDKYPNFKKWAGEATLNMLRSSDGKIYQIPNWYTNKPMGNGGWIVNKKIYKELGSPKLETTDDLYSYLTQVKAKYPGIVPLEVGDGAQGAYMMYSAFAEDQLNFYVDMRGVPTGNELKSIYTDANFKEYMLFVSKLFREKLMTQDAFTQTLDQVKEKINNGKVAVVFNSTTTDIGRQGNNELKAKDPEGGYEMIWPIHKPGLDKNKIWIDGYISLGWNVNVISKNAANPEAIFAYFDWVTGEEGQKLLFFGPPGLYWDKTEDDGSPIPNDSYRTTPIDKRTEDMTNFEKFNWAGNSGFIDKAKSKIEYSLPEDKRDWSTIAQNEVAWKTVKDMTEFTNVMPEASTEEGIIAGRLSDMYGQMFAKALYAKSDEEVLALIDKAAADADKAGLAKLLAYETKVWQDNLAKMHAK